MALDQRIAAIEAEQFTSVAGDLVTFIEWIGLKADAMTMTTENNIAKDSKTAAEAQLKEVQALLREKTRQYNEQLAIVSTLNANIIRLDSRNTRLIARRDNLQADKVVLNDYITTLRQMITSLGGDPPPRP